MISPRVSQGKYPLDSFPIDWRNGVKSEEITSLILWGESGIGKTQFAKALLPGALLASHIDDLRSFDPGTHNGIIFDDMDFAHTPRTSQIHLVDFDEDRSIHCRYDVAFIPAGTQKIFTTNEAGGRIVDLRDAAIKRRVRVVELIK